MDMHTSENTHSIVDVISWAIPEKLLISVQASFPKLIKRTIDFALFTAAAISVHSMGIPPAKLKMYMLSTAMLYLPNIPSAIIVVVFTNTKNLV